MPSFIVIYALSFAINAFQENTWYKAAFTGIQACVTILIINAFIKMFNQLTKDVFSIIVMVCAFLVATLTNFDVIYVILIGGVLGILYTIIRDSIDKKKGKKVVETTEVVTTNDTTESNDIQSEIGVVGTDEDAGKAEEDE